MVGADPDGNSGGLAVRACLRCHRLARLGPAEGTGRVRGPAWPLGCGGRPGVLGRRRPARRARPSVRCRPGRGRPRRGDDAGTGAHLIRLMRAARLPPSFCARRLMPVEDIGRTVVSAVVCDYAAIARRNGVPQTERGQSALLCASSGGPNSTSCGSERCHMKKARYPLAWCAVMAVAAAGCSSATSTPPSAGNGGTFSVAAFEPPSFIPGQNNGAANEELDAIYAPLTEFNPQNKLTDVQAQSVTASDGGLLWTITIKPGWTFQNGEPVTAQSYINAWNATAYGPNAWVDNGDLADIAGYPALNPASGKPATTTLSGLKALDATTIQVHLIRPDSQFPLELSTTPFLPLPNAYFKNPAAWESAPIGDGPYEVVGKWQPNKSLTVRRYPGYRGPRPNADRIVFDVYNNLDTAYTALQAGQLDIAFIGPGQYSEAERDMPSDVVPFSAPSIDFLGFPLYNSYFRNKLVREAISLAIDRQEISTKLFADLDTPATSLLPPAEAGAPANACPYCRYDPARE